MKSFFVCLILAGSLSACKKEYTCVCSNPGGEFKAFVVKNTESKAKEKCDDYYNTNFGSVPWNETHCDIR